MSMKSLLGAALIGGAVMSAQGAHAAMMPVSAETLPGAFVKVTAGRDDVTTSFAGPDNLFYSLGFGGLVVYDFGALFGGAISIFEATNNCALVGDLCVNHRESVEVYVSNSYTTGSFDISGFSLLGSVGNGEASTSGSSVLGSGRFVALLDTSPVNGGSFDGFDVDLIQVEQIPLPASMWMLVAAAAGLGFVARNRQVI